MWDSNRQGNNMVKYANQLQVFFALVTKLNQLEIILKTWQEVMIFTMYAELDLLFRLMQSEKFL